MACQSYKLYKGTLEFHNDKLLIFDHSWWSQRIQYFLIIVQMLLAISFLWRGIDEKNGFLLWLGIALLVVWLSITMVWLVAARPSGEKELPLSQIRQAKRSKGGYTWEMFQLKLGNKRVRSIMMDKSENAPNRFQEQLQVHNIPVVF